MRLPTEQLAAHLARGRLSHCYVVSGDEALLSLEAQDAIRAAARVQGYTERQVLHADARMDWSALQQAATGLSLFASRQLLEVRLPSGKPGKNGAVALQAHAQRKDEDTLTIISLPALDWAARKTAWVATLESAATWIDVTPVTRDRLPEWLAGRLARQKQSATRPALEFLADQVEGNLLAAHQEISKLHLLYGDGEVDIEQIRSAIFDVARFEGVSLPGAMIAGDRVRIVRTVAGLRAEGEPLPLLLWMVSEELRNLLRLHQAVAAGRPFAGAVRGMRLGAPHAVVERLLPRLAAAQLAGLLGRCADLDRIAKGLSVATRDDDPWLELTEVALGLSAVAAGSPASGTARAVAPATPGRSMAPPARSHLTGKPPA
jgi:DNA polymerase-3 subunit delta